MINVNQGSLLDFIIIMYYFYINYQYITFCDRLELNFNRYIIYSNSYM